MSRHWAALFAESVLASAAIPAILFSVNVWLFRRPGRSHALLQSPPPAALSVLIPARNEELSIGPAISSVLASRGAAFELIVLDDASTDLTAEIVRGFAETDGRVRLATAPPLPAGWNGKQHACWVLASLATHDVFCFLDADVRLGPEALGRMLAELNSVAAGRQELALVSGFPRQQTLGAFEWLLLPLIHFVLLGFLPLPGERSTGMSAFAAGCGQFLMVRRAPYFASAGHAAIRATMHDGLLLPQLFRSSGFRTRVYDLSADAACRMYRSAGEVWRGLAKNATEGIATPARIPFFTVLLLLGQVAPLPLAAWAYLQRSDEALRFSLWALGLGYGVRIVSAILYRQSWLGVATHPAGVLLLLILQWYALLRKLLGRPANWKDRTYSLR